jgi:SAM-dependent methyltransferase
MSSNFRYLLEVVSPGTGAVLDLGGGRGTLRYPLKKLGYNYINLDISTVGNDEPSLIGDAHTLPFQDFSFDLVVSKDTLEHFFQPHVVVQEVYRVLKKDGQFAIWVPFLHPFHGNDLYRYTPLGLRHLLKDFEVLHLDSPLWLFSVIGLVVGLILERIHLRFLKRPIEQACKWLDAFLMQSRQGPASFAAAYRIVARKNQSPRS